MIIRRNILKQNNLTRPVLHKNNYYYLYDVRSTYAVIWPFSGKHAIFNGVGDWAKKVIATEKHLSW
jgi:hypothetical protein